MLKDLEGLYKLIEQIEFTDKDFYYEVKQALIKAQENEEVLEILKKYAKNDGWSDGWTIEFWNMKPNEINKVCGWLNKE